ncbi:hypothetical protein BABINDRAFT_159628 [Babjeviella inositovora NRRL Y-12698]|uniref:Uncharacterized protein n=1 Tax=Babjeviella inositovora NRRL Y-12698 TaxID=984486 RepID=A0A1E3QZW1_9ASCO|nr:uncharacterized protein BABINDRAFT_159628 [Babjeviella inositovora NRRL Y-12698]ODQ83186.1 hypothetical protein BABINDRAFT_159628 [Babjeviella inositovora NRRL Y-12698]
MVTKLTFKGDKPKKRKRTEESASSKKAKPVPEFDRSLVEQGWTTATTVSDITGPIIITRYDEGVEGAPYSIASNKGKLFFSSELDILPHDQCVNFPPDEVAAPYLVPIHLSEPRDTTQVFTVTQIRSLDTGKKNQLATANEISVTFRSAEGKYLSLSQQNTLDALAEAVGPGETFTLTKKFKSGRGVWWALLVNNAFKVCTLPAADDGHMLKCIKDKDGVLDDENHYVIRVQTKNSVRGKQIMAEIENNDTKEDRLLDTVREAIVLLDKENIMVTNAVFKQLMAAAQEGRLNEAIIDVKTKGKHDSRC